MAMIQIIEVAKMIDSISKCTEKLTNNWCKPSTALFVCIVVTVTSGAFFKYEVDKWFVWWQWCLIVSSCIVALLVWYMTTRPKKCPRNKVGVILAIYPEDDEDEKILNSDFISHIDNQSIQHKVCFWQLSKKEAQQVTNKESARKYCENHNARMIIWGQFKKRSIQGQEERIIKCHALICHNPVANAVSMCLGRSMSALLPLSKNIKKDNEFRELELLADQTSTAATYFLAVSLCISGQSTDGVQILDDLRNKLLQSNVQFWKRDVIYQAISTQLGGSYIGLANTEYSQWIKDKNPNRLLKMDSYLNCVQKRNLQNDGYHILRAIYLFVSKRDVNAALTEYSYLDTKKSACNMFNLAFLYAYKGILSKSWTNYQRATTIKNLPKGLVSDVIIFIKEVIVDEPENNGLNYALGIVYHYFSQDKESSRKYLEAFLARADMTRDNIPIQRIQQILNPSLRTKGNKVKSHNKHR